MNCEHCGTPLVVCPPFEIAVHGYAEIIRAVSVEALRAGLPLVEQIMCDEAPDGLHFSPALARTRRAR